MPVKRELDSDDGISSANSSFSSTTENRPVVKRRKVKIESTENENQAKDILERPANRNIRLNDSQIDFNTCMTQVDEKWSKHKTKNIRRLDLMTQHTGEFFDDSPSDSGVIEKLELFNFMCHKAFTLPFGSQTNFIIGRNGSGKSAILTGISVALGAKATDTDRGNSLKNLIMHGKNVARAIVTIKNKGHEAYKREEFGDKIIIERVLKMEGTHSVFIKNSRNKTISTKKKTIDAILEHFGITIANPMTILTQTEAKTFLAHSTDRDKYNSFMSGTRLKESFDNIKKLELNKNEIKQFLDTKKNVYEEHKQKFDDCRKVYESFNDSDVYDQKKRILVGKKFWFVYKQHKRKSKHANLLVEKKTNEITNMENQITQINDEIIKCDEEKQLLQSGELDELKQKVQENSQTQLEIENVINADRDSMRSIQRKMAGIEESIKANEKDLVKLERDIEREQRRIDSSSEETVEKLKAFKEKQEKKITTMNLEKENFTSNIESLKQEKKHIEKEFELEISLLYKECDTLKSKIRHSQQTERSNQPESMFPSEYIKLMRGIKSTDWSNQVIGPLGMHIELKKDYEKWSTVLENILQRALTSFLVENYKTAQAVTQKIKFFGVNSEVTIRKPEVFDYSHSTPKSKYPSILDALNITDDNLKCFLVDAFKAHATLLVADREEANKELDNDTNNLISSVICLVNDGVLRVYKKNNSFQSDAVNMQKSHRMVKLRISGDSLVQRYQRDLYQANKTLDYKKSEMAKTLEDPVNKLKEFQKKLYEIQNEQKEINKSIKKTNDKLDTMIDGTSEIDALKDERQNLLSSISLNAQKLEPLNKTFQELAKNIENQKEFYDSVKSDVIESKNLLNKKNGLLKKYFENIELHKSNINNINNQIVALRGDIEKLKGFIDAVSETIKESETKASEFCTFEEANLQKEDTSELIDEAIMEVQNRIEEIERTRQISKESAESNLLSATRELKEIESKYSETINTFNRLNESLDKRLDNLMQTTILTFQEVESVFVSALKVRRFRGKIEFNIKKGTLTLKVATKENAPLRAVESFSGGEKSYGQIAFLFAIWGPMHSKVRGLDEFDVFMDNVNRRIALKLILQKVRENPKRQTIFITPLSVSGVEGLEDKSVNIHEISPPERANIN